MTRKHYVSRRNSILDRSTQENVLFTSRGIWVAVFVAFMIGFGLHGYGFMQQKYDRLQASWRTEKGTIITRGPYQGDAAIRSYRIATVRYATWEKVPATKEIMVPWNVQVGQHMTVRVASHDRVYVPADLTTSGDPTKHSYSGNFWGSLIAGAFLGAIFGIPIALLSWYLIIMILCWRKERSQQSNRAALAT